MNAKEKILIAIVGMPGTVVLRAELNRFASYSQVSKILANLVREGRLIRAGKGIFVKTKISSITGNTIASGSLETVATEALQKLGIEAGPGQATDDYNKRRTTQIPGKFVVSTGNRRISRRIEIGGRHLLYENKYKAR